jgi:hypothetical protein
MAFVFAIASTAAVTIAFTAALSISAALVFRQGGLSIEVEDMVLQADRGRD